jgi:hypothetical protein
MFWRSISTEAPPQARLAGTTPSVIERLGICWIGLLVALMASPGMAVDWQKMVMPGPLAEAHAELENDCSNCHQAFEIEAERSLCLACHEEVSADVESGLGYHGRNPVSANGPCRSCHADHRGRGADIRGLSEATFDHANTDYPLRGAHQRAACNDCHEEGRRRAETPSDCVSCHQDDDRHGDALPDDCGQCHREVRWKLVRFDHDETDHPLTGAHRVASCVGCHAAERYRETPTDCIACHAIDDAHSGRFGTECADCHTTAAWREKEFDHEAESGFPLVGAHRAARCNSCHRQPPGKVELPEGCVDCHVSDDVHARRFGTECGGCHSAIAWQKTRFDHAAETGFPLRDAHASVNCETCHAKPVEGAEIESRCSSCHLGEDVHRGSLGDDCGECHDEIAFAGRVRFDHDLTNFPLLGLHAIGTCESCHRDQRFQVADLSCRGCHANDDVHKETLGRRCESCHTPNAWMIWRFDHDERTRFALEGAHEGIACGACHQKPMGGTFQMPQRCVDCHASDDVHRGGFGRSCRNCHSEEAWRPARIGRSGG